MHKTGDSVATHLAKVAPAARRRDAETLTAMFEEITGRAPELWSGGIVGFGSCHYRYPTGNEGDSPIVGFAPRKAASTLYLLDGIPAHADMLARLGPHTTGVGCLYLKDVDAVDHDVLRAVIETSYRHVLGGGGDYATITVTD